jgi:hypothetical protein
MKVVYKARQYILASHPKIRSISQIASAYDAGAQSLRIHRLALQCCQGNAFGHGNCPQDCLSTSIVWVACSTHSTQAAGMWPDAARGCPVRKKPRTKKQSDSVNAIRCTCAAHVLPRCKGIRMRQEEDSASVGISSQRHGFLHHLQPICSPAPGWQANLVQADSGPMELQVAFVGSLTHSNGKLQVSSNSRISREPKTLVVGHNVSNRSGCNGPPLASSCSFASG